DLGIVLAVAEPVRSGAAERGGPDLPVARTSPQLYRARHGSVVGTRLHAAAVIEEVAHVGGHGDQGEEGKERETRQRHDLASRTISLLDAVESGRRRGSASVACHLPPPCAGHVPLGSARAIRNPAR